MNMLPVSSADLERVLPDYIAKQRWYRAKAKTIRDLRVADVIDFGGAASLIVVRVSYQAGYADEYLLPVTTEPTQDVLIEGQLFGALSTESFRNGLLEAIACSQSFEGQNGRLVAARTSALDRPCEGAERLQSSVSRAEQSNSSIIFRDRYILKLFRKLEGGINPDIEIGKYLTEHRFAYTPQVLGEIAYEPTDGERMFAGILQRFVANQGDAWKYTLDTLPTFFQKALRSGSAPQMPTYHPLQLMVQGIPVQAKDLIGPYMESARLLGERTAQMHAALTDEHAGPDFAPERFDANYASRLFEEMLDQAETTFDLLRDKQDQLSGESASAARQLISAEARLRDRFSSLRDHPVQAVRIRHHGDYHLGQVLYTGSDFVIIDFEGEPARPLAHRRIKTLAMRDVAGMIRSFSYAAFAGAPETENREQVEAWAGCWAAWVSAEFLKAYFDTANCAPFVGSSPAEHGILFDAFVLQKALYEVAYELNNRPDWVHIPLRGILNLIS